jgi:hypothetical protein
MHTILLLILCAHRHSFTHIFPSLSTDRFSFSFEFAYPNTRSLGHA